MEFKSKSCAIISQGEPHDVNFDIKFYNKSIMERFGRSRSSKVIDFVTNRKHVYCMQLPISPS